MNAIARSLAPALLAVLLAPMTAPAQTVEQFYRGKQVAFVASFAPGTDYDTWTRRIARHLAKHIPGNPSVIVQNMPGAGGLQGANYLANIAPRDGTFIMMIGRNLPYLALTRYAGVRFDPAAFNWIGSPEVATRVCAVLDNAPATRAEDLFNHEVLVGGNGAGSAVSTTPTLLRNLLGMKFKVIEGYAAPSNIILAMERGELHGFCSSYQAMQQTPGWIESGRLKILFNIEHNPVPELKAPSVFEFAKADEERRILSIYSSSVELGRPIGAPPGVPAERVAALRSAFEATMKDPTLVAEAAKEGLDITIVPGSQVQKLIDDLMASPPELVEKLNQLSQRH